MAGNDAEREEKLVACLNILRRTPIKDAEEVRYRWTAGRIKEFDSNGFLFEGVCLLLLMYILCARSLMSSFYSFKNTTPLSEYCGPSLPALISC